MTLSSLSACSAAPRARIYTRWTDLLQRRRAHLRYGALALYGLVTLNPVLAAAWAQPGAPVSFSARDAQVLSKAVVFFLPATAPAACVAIVFAAGDPDSRRDAEAVASRFGNAAGASCAIVVPSDGLARASGCSALFAAAGAPVDVVMEAARQQRIPCVTASLLLVEAGRCTMWVRSEPRVEIVVNHGALVSGGMGLAAAFRMMIREL